MAQTPAAYGKHTYLQYPHQPRIVDFRVIFSQGYMILVFYNNEWKYTLGWKQRFSLNGMLPCGLSKIESHFSGLLAM